MARYTAHALVIGVHPWGDADKVVELFTAEKGRVRAAAFGSRRPKSTLAAALQLFNELDVSLTEGQRLDTVRTASIQHHPKKLSEDIVTMAYGSFVAECVSEFLPEKQPEPHVYDLLRSVFSAFETRNPRIVALLGVYQLMEFTGLQLSYERCVRCGRLLSEAEDALFSESAGGALCSECHAQEGTSSQPYPAALRRFIAAALAFDWQSGEKLTIATKDLLAAEAILIGYLQRLLGHPLRSLSFLQKL